MIYIRSHSVPAFLLGLLFQRDKHIQVRNTHLHSCLFIYPLDLHIIQTQTLKWKCKFKTCLHFNSFHIYLIYVGYARLSNVEFYHTGQEGFTEEYDPRLSLAYVATGTVSDVKPSFVSKCSFHNGFNTAVGAYGIGSLNITDNVVFGSIGEGKYLD